MNKNVYEVVGRPCSYTGENVILREMTDKEAKEWLRRGLKRGAVFACRHGCSCTVNWLFANKSVKAAKSNLRERYILKSYDGEWEETRDQW